MMHAPQHAAMQQQHVGAYMVPHQGVYGSYHASSQWGQPGLACYQTHMLPGPGEEKFHA
jgi:hypothetical protein